VLRYDNERGKGDHRRTEDAYGLRCINDSLLLAGRAIPFLSSGEQSIKWNFV
jgi:hypothetical protein